MQLGNGCKYTLDVNGQAQRVFSSEQELDAFLADNIDSIIETFVDKTMNKIYSIDPQQGTINKINAIKQSIANVEQEVIRYGEDPEEYETYYKIPNAIGVNKFFSKYGDPADPSKPLNVPFNSKAWKTNHINDLTKALIEQGKSESEAHALATKITEDTEASWKDLTDIGTEIHSILESVIKNDPSVVKSKILDENGLTDQVKSEAQQLINRIKLRHGGDCQFMSELGIMSKTINPDIKALMPESKDAISGVIDLLVIDRDGTAHIYDFKVSRKNVGNWEETLNKVLNDTDSWHSAKKRNITNQLAAYNAILQQYGIKVASCNVCPIKLDVEYTDENKSSISKFTNVKFNDILHNIKGTRSGQAFNNVLQIISPEVKLTNESMLKVFNALEEIAPNVDIQMKVERRHSDVEFYKNHPEVIALRKLPKDHAKAIEGYKYMFREKGIGKERWEYATDDSDLEIKLNNYVEKLNAQKSNELTVIADDLQAILGGDMEFEDLVKNYRDDQRQFITNQFKRYVDQNWNFVKDENLNSAGYFIFRKSGRTEIVMISNKPLLQTLNLGVGTTLLGKTLANEHVNTKEIYEANYGSLELMKAMIYISQNQDLFVDDKIAEIRVINPWAMTNKEMPSLNSQLINNYNSICLQNQNSENLKSIRTDIFWDDVTALVAGAHDREAAAGSGWLDFELVPDARDELYNADWIYKQITSIRSKYSKLHNPENYNPDDDVWNAYVYLYRAYMAANGVFTASETSPGQFFGKNITEFNGYMISSAQFSSSINHRVFGEVLDQYANEVRGTMYKMGLKIQNAFNEFYKEARVLKALGGERDLFKSWFVTKADGSIDEHFCLKNPDSPDFQGSPKAKKALKAFLETMAKLRWPNMTEAELEDLKLDPFSEYYQVPLTQATFTQQAKNLNVWTAFKNKIKEGWQITTDMFAEDEGKGNNGIDIREMFKSQHRSVYNKFALTPEQRLQKIQEHGIGFFETHLEIVFNEALQAYVKQNVSKKYVPIFQGMRLSLAFQKHHSKQSLDKVIDTFDKLVKSKFYGESIIEEDLQPLQRFIGMIKKGFSTMALSLNFTSFFRETLHGMYTGATRAGVKFIDGIDEASWIKANAYMLKEAPKNFSGVSMLQQLNQIYGMSNMSLSNVANQRRMNWFGIRNWDRSTAFLTAWAPDFQHRMSILVAKMMKDGSWEAHSVDSEGNLVYDWKKDPRFKEYITGNTSHKDYLYQKTLYLKYLEEFNRIGMKKDDGTEYAEGDALPQAYPPKEGQRIKNFADYLYGHYDDESRALLNDTLFGGLFMQYKTFTTALVEQYFNKPGVYNTEQLKQQYDPITKERLYVKYVYPNPDNTGIPQKEIIKESELTDEDRNSGLVESYIKWEGDPMEGVFRSAWSTIKAMKDPDKFKELWNNPTKRAGFLLAINDTFLMALIAMIINALFGTGLGVDEPLNQSKVRQAARQDSPATSFAYNVLWGATQDTNMVQLLTGMFSDVNPPVLTAGKRLAQSMGSVLAGNKGVAEALSSNFGAVREFQYAIRQWEQNK